MNSIHKIGELLVRTHYHPKWNKEEWRTLGTIIDFDRETFYYKVWWWDDWIFGQKLKLESPRDIIKYKENLKYWLEHKNENR